MKFDNSHEDCQARAFSYAGVKDLASFDRPTNVTVICGDRQATLATTESGSSLKSIASSLIEGFCVGCENKIGSAALLALPRPEGAES